MAGVMIVNPFEVEQGNEKQALAQWDAYAAYFSNQPGYVSAKLFRALTPEARFQLVTVAEWESAADFMAAVSRPELQELMEHAIDHSPSYPGMYEVVRG